MFFCFPFLFISINNDFRFETFKVVNGQLSNKSPLKGHLIDSNFERTGKISTRFFLRDFKWKHMNKFSRQSKFDILMKSSRCLSLIKKKKLFLSWFFKHFFKIFFPVFSWFSVPYEVGNFNLHVNGFAFDNFTICTRKTIISKFKSQWMGQRSHDEFFRYAIVRICSQNLKKKLKIKEA